MITAFHVQLNKTTTADLVWEVLQERSYPSITGRSNYFHWTSCDDVLPAFGNGDPYMTERYTCIMRNSDSVKLRGRTIGEIKVSFQEYPDLFHYVREGNSIPSPFVQQFYDIEVVPRLRQFILDNFKALRKEAILGIRRTVDLSLVDARTQIEKLADEMEAALVKLEGEYADAALRA